MYKNTKISGILLLISTVIFLLIFSVDERTFGLGWPYMAVIVGLPVIVLLMLTGIVFSIVATVKERTVWRFVFMGIYTLIAVSVGGTFLFNYLGIPKPEDPAKAEIKREAKLIKAYEKNSGRKVLCLLNSSAASAFLLDMVVPDNTENLPDESKEVSFQYETARIVGEDIEIRVTEEARYISVPDTGLHIETRILKLEHYKNGVYRGASSLDDQEPWKIVEQGDREHEILWKYYSDHKRELRKINESTK